jgi:hypothetical protein
MHCVGRKSQWFHGENAFTTALGVGIMRCMSQTPESWVPPASAAPPPKPERLYQVAAWVVIVGGIILIVANILFFICAIWCCH